MPITQARFRDLLEEYERTITSVNARLRAAEEINASRSLTDRDRFELLYNEVLLLSSLPRTYAIVERRDLNRNWKRNQSAAAKQERTRRAKGIAPRGKPTDTDWLPHESYQGRFPSTDDYESFDRDARFAPETASMPTPTRAVQTSEYDIHLCQHELGLANKPTEEQYAKWCEARSRPEKRDLRDVFGKGEGDLQ
jgi:hypothetical protein